MNRLAFRPDSFAVKSAYGVGVALLCGTTAVGLTGCATSGEPGGPSDAKPNTTSGTNGINVTPSGGGIPTFTVGPATSETNTSPALPDPCDGKKFTDGTGKYHDGAAVAGCIQGYYDRLGVNYKIDIQVGGPGQDAVFTVHNITSGTTVTYIYSWSDMIVRKQ